MTVLIYSVIVLDKSEIDDASVVDGFCNSDCSYSSMLFLGPI